MENWRAVVGSDDRYEVSEAGGLVRNTATGKLVKPYWQGRYLAFTVHKGSSRQIIRLHVAVLEAFRGARPEGMVAAHLDGDRGNCDLSNLAWTSSAENEGHKILHGSDKRGEKSEQARFSNTDAQLVRKAHGMGLTIAELARIANVNPSTIHKIVRGSSYAH